MSSHSPKNPPHCSHGQGHASRGQRQAQLLKSIYALTHRHSDRHTAARTRTGTWADRDTNAPPGGRPSHSPRRGRMGGPRPGLRPLRRARGAAAAASARPPGSARGAAPRPAPPPVPAPAPPPDPPHRPEGGAGAGLRTSRGRGRLGDRRPTHAPPAATEAPPAPTPPAPLLQLSRGSCRSCLRCRAGESLSRIPDPGSRILHPRHLPLAPDGSRKGQRSGSQGLGGRSVTKRQLDSRVFGLWEPVRAVSWRCPSRLSWGAPTDYVSVVSAEQGETGIAGASARISGRRTSPRVEGQYAELWEKGLTG